MDWAHHRQPRHYQGRSHAYYNQYQPNFNESSSWTLWRSPPPPAAYAKGRRRRWGGVLLGAAAFSVVLAVVVITGLAIYMGALKLDVTQYMMLDGSFRVISGDFYNVSLLDHSSDLFQRKSHIYKLMIESVLRRSDLSPAVKQCSILGFSNGSLVVFFRLILDRRKLPKKSVNIEEWLKSLLVQKIPAASPVKNFRIDKTQVLLRRQGDELNHAASLEIENKNQTLQLHNGLLRKSPPQIVTSNYTSTPSSKTKIPKTNVPNIGTIEGSFKLSIPEISNKNHMINFSTEILQPISETTTSSHDHHAVKKFDNTSDEKTLIIDKPSSKIDFYQHSPALNAFLNQRPTIERVTYSKSKGESTEPVFNYSGTDLITLLPYTFQNEEEPWKPMLPENFTRYPERRPISTEDYGSGGVGIVEVVMNPEDLTSSVPSKPFFPGVGFSAESPVYLKTSPVNASEYLSFQKQTNPKYEGFGPRSDNKMAVLLNTQSDKNEGKFENYNNVYGDSNTKDKYGNKLNGESSAVLGDILPEFPIIQQFHDLDSLLRTYNTKDSSLKKSDVPVTLIPARSNLDMKRRIRPRPSQTPEVITDQADTVREPVWTENSPEVEIKDTVMLKVNLMQNKSYNNPPQKENNKHMIKISNNMSESSSEENVNTYEIQTQVSSKLLQESNFHNPPFLKDSLANNHGQVDDLFGTETTIEPDTVHFVQISKNGGSEEEPFDYYIDYTTEKHEKMQGEGVETESASDSLIDLSSRSQRNSILTNIAPNEDSPLKFDLQDGSKIDLTISSAKITNTNSTGANTTEVPNEPLFVMKLKDTKLQELLEKIIYNLTTDHSIAPVATKSHNSSSVIVPFSLNNFSGYEDITVAQNRKYGQSFSDSKNSLMKNSSFFNMKPDVILYYLKNPSKNNESSEDFKDETKSNSKIKNEQNSAVNKSSHNYALSKNGFLMLTKVFNKVTPNVHPNKESLVKSNFTGNHTAPDCLGNINIKCGSGECISSLSRCNNLVDCIDGSDEKNCTCAEFLKAQYLTRKICDGVVDCWDFSDENSCEWCTSNQYVCSNSRVCVDRVRVCNGELDCPNGDDEKNCVSIAPNMSQSDMMNYYSSGILMIRKEGNWGKLCTQNFEALSSIFKSRWTLEDLGKVVCKTMTFRFFASIEHINDTSKDEDTQNKYYELLYSKEASQLKSPRLGLTFGDTNCAEKKVVRITCSNLECGVRPQANPQWGRSKRLSGSRHSRIVGGGNAGPGSWPWLAALYKEGEFQCGATLISDRWLLSAGHCFYHSLDDYWVARLGALRRGTNLPSPYEQLRVVSRILLHPNYIDAGFINDISLLQMEKPVSLTNYVRPICLPKTNAVLQDGKMCTVIGWGQLFEVGRIFPDTLQEVQLPVISTAECRKRTLFLPLYKVTENMFCAGYDRGGRDACLGDSGGPLMCQENDGRWSLMGVTSNGYGCARANRPGVYTKVANYVSWVHSSMANDGVTTDKHPKGRNISCHGHRCPLGECLPPARICNGFMECSDGSDEKDCW